MIVVYCPVCGESTKAEAEVSRVVKYKGYLTVTFNDSSPPHTCPPDPSRDREEGSR